MGTRWYESRTNQAALIGAFAAVLVALIGVYVSQRESRYPPVEVKDLTPSGEQVLARLALSPAKQLLDSAAFAALAEDDLLWNDSIGVALAKPTSYEWGVAEMGVLEGASIRDVLYIRWVNDMTRRGFGQPLIRGTAQFFGVRLDKPTRITLTADTRLDSTRIGANLFQNRQWFLGFLRMMYGASFEELPRDTVDFAQREAATMLDSVARSYLPSERAVYNGVFVARVTAESLERTSFDAFLKRPLLDDAFAAVGISIAAPTMFIVDRDRGTLIFSDALLIENAAVDGQPGQSVTLNRAGYAVQRGPAVHIVLLQYVSNQPKEVLAQLQRYLSSVRLRADSA